jgi:hypothetical protein
MNLKSASEHTREADDLWTGVLNEAFQVEWIGDKLGWPFGTSQGRGKACPAELSLKHLPKEIIVVCRSHAGWQSEDASRT